MATPRGFGGAAGGASRPVLPLLHPRPKVLFPLLRTYPSGEHAAPTVKIYPTKPQRIPAVALSDTAPTSPCGLLLWAWIGLTKGRLDNTVLNF
jgi:hypothetical protein